MVIVIVAVLVAFGLTACGSGEKIESQEPEIVKYKVDIGVECTENVFFNKYDVKVLLNDAKELRVVEHGASAQYGIDLEEGEYELRLENEEDNTVDGTVNFTVCNI